MTTTPTRWATVHLILDRTHEPTHIGGPDPDHEDGATPGDLVRALLDLHHTYAAGAYALIGPDRIDFRHRRDNGLDSGDEWCEPEDGGTIHATCTIALDPDSAGEAEAQHIRHRLEAALPRTLSIAWSHVTDARDWAEPVGYSDERA